MIAKTSVQKRRAVRVRSKIFGTKDRPRLSVHRTSKHIYGQLIDDSKGVTLTSYSSLKIAAKDKKGKTKKDVATLVGTELASLIKKLKIKKIAFDRGGNRYQGRVKSMAEALRAGELDF